MQFEEYTIALLLLRPDAPELGERAAAELQDRHMAHLADLHDAGQLLAAGPVFDPKLRGLSILNVRPEDALGLKDLDPGVIAGRFSVQVARWMVPGGAMRFAPARFPRSMAEAQGT
jgi:uncharacterized protein YciI